MLSIYVTTFSTISRYLTKLFVAQSFAVASSVTYSTAKSSKSFLTEYRSLSLIVILISEQAFETHIFHILEGSAPRPWRGWAVARQELESAGCASLGTGTRTMYVQCTPFFTKHLFPDPIKKLSVLTKFLF